MNIDAYLHQVHSANGRLKEVVDSVKQVVSEGIEKKIDEIRRVILFDKKLATSRVWNVDKFVEDECKAVSQQGHRLHEMVKEVENSLQVTKWLNGPFAASSHMVQNPPCWRASCPLGHPEQSDFIKTNLHFLCFGCPSA